MSEDTPGTSTDHLLRCAESLAGLGFSALEATVYTALLSGPQQTGYQIAHAIGKPVANTYKAITSLERKGAVLVALGDKRLCRAVPWPKLMAKLSRDFQADCDRAEQALATIPQPVADEGIYELRSPAQVHERFTTMLELVQEVVYIDAFPPIVADFTDPIAACAARGVRVVLKVYEPVEIPGVTVVVDPAREATLAAWPGQWLNVVIDATEHMLAFLTPDRQGVHKAIWSDSLYLALIYAEGIRTEIMLDELGIALDSGNSRDQIQAAFENYRQKKYIDSPGRRALIAQYTASGEEKGAETQ